MQPIDWRDYVISDPTVLAGKPHLKDTRLSIEFVFELLAGGWDHDAIRDNYPNLTEDRIRAALAYAAETFREERFYVLPPAGQIGVAERYLADENFPAAIVRYLRSQGDDVFFVAESMASASDEVIRSAAVAEDRVILTFDSDFGELVVRRQGTAAGVVLFRLKQQSPDVLLPFLMAFFSLRPTLRGFFTVATPNQFRQRRLR